jgi:hypothetical protein
MSLPNSARQVCAAAITTAATLLALGAALGPLFYMPPRSGRWTLETQIRFFSPFIAPFAGASLAGVVLGERAALKTVITGALALLGLVLGMQTRPWVLWAGTTAMARANTLWVTGAVFTGGLVGRVVAARFPHGAQAPEGPSKARVTAAAHLAIFGAVLVGGARVFGRTQVMEIILLGLAGAGALTAMVGPYRRWGAEAVRLAATVLLAWLAGFLWREMR